MVLNRADFNVRTGEKVEDIKKGEDGIFTVTTANEPVPCARGRPGAGTCRHSAQTRRQGRRTAQGDVPPDRGGPLRQQEDSGCRRRRQRRRSGDGAGAPGGQQGDAVVPAGAVQPHQGAQREAHREYACATERSKCCSIRSRWSSSQSRVILDVKGKQHEIPNDFVWIFAGGTPPNDFLKKIGVGFGMHDMILEASKEAHQAGQSTKELAETSAS